MPGHFDCVGLTFHDRDEFGRMMLELAGRAERATGSGGTRLLWSDPSGARVAMFVDERGSIQCAKPSFAGDDVTAVTARHATRADDPQGCPYCALTTFEVVDGDEMAYPLAIELDDLHVGELATAGDETVPVPVVAFAERITTWSDPDAYHASQEESPGLAERSLIPSGLFTIGDDPRPPRAEAIVGGVVLRAERKTNAYTSVSFDWCVLDTYATTLAVVAAAAGKDPFAPGQVVQGTFWLVGRRAAATP